MESLRQKIYVAVGKDLLESVYAFQWALHNRPQDSLILLHVQLPITTIPSLVGNIPVNRVSQDVLNAHKEDEQKRLNDCMEFYLKVCSQAKVKAEPLIVEREDVCRGIVEMVSELGIMKLIMGTSKPKIQRQGKAGYVLKHAINSCDISIVCRGKLVLVREGSVVDNEDFARTFSLQSNFQRHLASSIETPGNFPVGGGFTMSVGGDCTPHWPDQVNKSRFEASLNTTAGINELSSEIQMAETHYSVQAESQVSQEKRTDNETLKFQLTEALEVAENAKRDVQRETVRRKKAEAAAMKSVRKITDIKAALENAILVSKAKEEYCQELTRRLKEAEEELLAMVDKGSSLAAQVKQLSHECHQAIQERQVAEQDLAAMEEQNYHILKQKEAEIKQLQDLLHYRSRVETPSSSSNNLEFSEYSMEEVKAATGNFSDHFKIGGGGYGSVYKAKIREATVAVKIVGEDSLQGREEFQREIDILRDIRHPNLVTVVGACFEQGCILYEYMTNGSLADRLSCKNATLPLPWRVRIRIAAEVCSGLQFLHSLNPEPIVHRDLKPENILLDENYGCKISDFGLARRLPRDVHKESELEGTFLYMDPEYLRSGEYSTKSDVYSLGMIFLQLLTGKPALGLVKEVESALENAQLDQVLDPSAGRWPFAQATQLADLALHCTEPIRKKRPDIQPTVMKMLDKLRNFTIAATDADRPGRAEESHVPGFFLCPIFKAVMQDPYVAADGFTYEQVAIQEWFDRGHDTSPMTNEKLERKELLANYSLRSAIRQWQESGNLL